MKQIKTIFVVEFTNTRNVNVRWLGSYYFKSRELAKKYAEDFVNNYSIEKISYRIIIFYPQ